jgi:diguanylate cyclase (GGDEF)-like protein
VGDRVLADVSAMLTKSVRQNDVIGRLGGEEFAILLPETERGAAIQLAERSI